MEQPFDARRAMLEGVRKPARTWSTPALVTGLRFALLGDTALKPASGATSAAWCSVVYGISSELTRRGIDGSSLIRYGFLPEVVGRLLTLALESWSPSGDSEGLVREGPASPQAAEAWVRLLPRPAWDPSSVSTSGGADHLQRYLLELTVAVLPWLASASTDDLVTLRCPSRDELMTAPSPDPELVPMLNQYRWLVDHFSETHLQQWGTPSLHAELRWMLEDELPPCGATLMADRAIDLDALRAEVATRAIRSAPVEVPGLWPGMQQTLAAKMHGQALIFLKQRRYREAAALFEFAARENPRDARVVNNLGFCLIPVDALAALRELQRAKAMGYDDTLINGYNQTLCLMLLGRVDEAAQTLVDALQDSSSSEVSMASLWVLHGGGLHFEERIEVTEAVHRLRRDLRHSAA